MQPAPEPPDPAGPVEALQAALQRHEQALLRHARYLLYGDEHAAQDVVQETFMRLLKSPPDPGQPDGPWLFRVCRNLAIDRLRHQAREQRMTVGLAMETDEAAVDSPRPDGRLVSSVLAMLNARQLEVVQLRFQSGLRYREIADVLNVETSTVGVLLHQALNAIRLNTAQAS